jgi:hypothetical protein
MPFERPTPFKVASFGLAALLLAPLLAAPARAVELSPYFPLPNYFETKGKDAVLGQQISWLEEGIAALDKARAETREQLEKKSDDAALKEKLDGLDAQYAAAVKERDILKSDASGRDAERGRKDIVVSNLNRWINGLSRKATEQLKIAILKDGIERDAAERRHLQLSGQADDLEQAKHQSSFEAWGR